MSGARKVRGAGLTAVRSAARFVRLAHLRKVSECEQVAAVCFRVRKGEIEFLLVRTRGSGRWTFPKGSAEPGLTHAQAAALEAFEEAGVHGRIEEASFARYVPRRSSVDRSAGKEVAINAHLCEVMRLSPPQESNRSRTWFSVEDARKSLREGRASRDGAEFLRVVDRAVVRIHSLASEKSVVADPPLEHRSGRDGLQGDALQRVRFDFAEAYGRSLFTSYAPRHLGDIRQFSVPASHARRPLQCDVLEFEASPESNRGSRWFSAGKKMKALGSGTKSG
jgi:8-oxo-dGTP pyrophosphatase MutT (NUDIX family)